MILTATNKGFRTGKYNVTFGTSSKKGYILLETTNTDKYIYENGYNKTFFRKLSKKGTIKFDGWTVDLNQVDGIESMLEKIQ